MLQLVIAHTGEAALFWRHLKKQILANRFFHSLAAELRELWRCLNNIAADCQHVRCLIGARAS